jgi:hypothetical protein
VKFTLHYSGNDRQGNQRVGFIDSKKASRFSSISERIKDKFHNITFVNVYAPTEDEIVSVCDEIPKHDAIITLGDFNAKLARNNYTNTPSEDVVYMKSQTTMVLD